MTRNDMSEYQERHSVSRLIGAPPGYVGYDEGGQLTEAVRRKPYSVVLLDEIEKAHPDVFNILLQVLDEGRLTDNKGRHADFKNTIIIMTSNVGSQLIQQNYEEAGDDWFNDELTDKTRGQVMGLLKQTIRPEFLNRIDDIIMFTPLSRKDIREIVKLQFKLVSHLLKNQGVDVDISEEAIDYLARIGFDPLFGARPIKRALQRYVLNDLSKKLLADEVDKEKQIVVDFDGESLIFKN
jgi:ATP-dependent Clp protease ATP-binding subunit ClpB